jgi:hypothetical protein
MRLTDILQEESQQPPQSKTLLMICPVWIGESPRGAMILDAPR